MTKLSWDQAGERLFETGIDLGVLYLSDGSGIPWNGLTSIEEDFGDESSESHYFDGIKQGDSYQFGNFSATISAYTYPDEFLEYEGSSDLGSGLIVDSQQPKTFGLSYRTLIGNDVDNTEHGYRIHILYNLTAVVSPKSYSTVADQAELIEFSWVISGLPENIEDYRPTAHVIFDSRFLPEALMRGVEGLLYGSLGNARLPTLQELFGFVTSWSPVIIYPRLLPLGISDLVSGTGDLTESYTPGIFTPLPETRLTETTEQGVYFLFGDFPPDTPGTVGYTVTETI